MSKVEELDKGGGFEMSKLDDILEEIKEFDELFDYNGVHVIPKTKIRIECEGLSSNYQLEVYPSVRLSTAGGIYFPDWVDCTFKTIDMVGTTIIRGIEP